jgi:hypothetical protein
MRPTSGLRANAGCGQAQICAHSGKLGVRSPADPEVIVKFELLGDRAPLEVLEPDKFILLATE